MKSKVPQYKRDPTTDPHLPHTLKYTKRDIEHLIPQAAQAVINEYWPEVIRTFQQYDEAAGMLMFYRTVRDATKAAGWPDNMAYQMRDYLIGKLNAAKVKPFPGDRVFKIGEASQRMVKYVDKTGKEREVPWIDFNRKKKQAPPRAVESQGQALASFLLEDDPIPYEAVYGKKIKLINNHGQPVMARVTGYVGQENGVVFQIQHVPGWPLAGDNQTERQLRQQGWIIPKIVVTDVRSDEIKRLAGEMFAQKNPPNPS